MINIMAISFSFSPLTFPGQKDKYHYAAAGKARHFLEIPARRGEKSADEDDRERRRDGRRPLAS